MSALASIVVPCHDNLAYTALCLESVARHTPEPHEVVVVDNGCSDATSDWCAAPAGRAWCARRSTWGSPAGSTSAWAPPAATWPWSSTTTPWRPRGWLAGLLGALAREPGVGVAGPRSNWVSDDQIIPRPPYDAAPSDDLDRFAAERHRELAGQGREVGRLSGLCLAIAPAVLDAVGGFDTRFRIGNLEDDDYALRVRLAGFRLWVADDSFVHHFGHKTFAIVDEDYDALLYENALRYAAKWDLPADADPRGLMPGRGFDPARDRVPLPS